MEKIGEKSDENSWDKKSESYAKFSGELGDFGKRVFEILRGWSVSFAGKSVLDVGAARGVIIGRCRPKAGGIGSVLVQ